MKTIILFLILSLNLFAQSNLLLLTDDDLFVYSIDVAGSSEYGTTTASPNLNLIEFTIIGWFKMPASLAGSHHILGTDHTVTRGWDLYMYGDEVSFMGTNATGQVIVTSGANLVADTWYFIAVTCTTATQTNLYAYEIYVDALIPPRAGAITITASETNSLVVGARRNGDNDVVQSFWLGQIGEMQIITGHGLTRAEITAAFTNGLSASYSAGTVAIWYKWSGGDNTTMLKDYSASGNNLTGNNLTTADQVKIKTSYK